VPVRAKVNVGSRERSRRLDFVAGNLLSRAALLVRLLVRQVDGSELSRSEGEVLAILDEGPRRVTELAELVGLAQPTMTLLVRRLEQRGLVSRDGVPHDARVVLVAITRSGLVAVESFRARFAAALRSDLEGLEPAQLAELADATRALGTFVEQLQREAGV
jgi:DNA-binding MarR family transcriptional regulator